MLLILFAIPSPDRASGLGRDLLRVESMDRLGRPMADLSLLSTTSRGFGCERSSSEANSSHSLSTYLKSPVIMLIKKSLRSIIPRRSLLP